jgi:transcriptional regulator with XRE-family HTH domain
MTFGHYLHETRRRQQIPLNVLAELARIPRETLLDLESNRRGPSYTEVQQLAAALQRPEMEVLERAGIIGVSRAPTT